MSAESDSFSILRDRAYELAFAQLEPGHSAVATLMDEGVSQILAEAAVEAAYDLRHEKALRGELTWGAFLESVVRKPTESGMAIKVLTAATLLVALLAVWWKAERFPLIPFSLTVLATGLVFFGLGTIPVFRWRKAQLSQPAGEGRPPSRGTNS